MFDLNLHDHDHDQDQDMFSPQLQSCSSSSSLSNPIRGSCDDFSPQPHKQEAKEIETSCNQSPPTLVESDGKEVIKFKIRREGNNINSSAKWMSSKMRMMRKMISSDNGSTVVDHPPTTTTTKLEDHQQQELYETDNNSSNTSSCNNSSSVRVCADCNTTKTPLWRSGPTGPKSLCNACGIRQRKARRAMAAAINGEAGINPPPMKKAIKHKKKRSSPTHSNNNAPKFKKRCKINASNSPSITSNRKMITFEDLRMSLISNSGFEQVFPQDEKEAAILLMALSYGLVH